MNQQAIVIIPIGVQSLPDHALIDFEAVFQALIKPSLAALKLTAIQIPCASLTAGLSAEHLQALLTADIVVADLSLQSPAIYYAIGVREALRANGLVIVAALNRPSDEDRLILPAYRYRLSNGVPNPETLDDELQALSQYIEKLLSARIEKPASPIFQQIPKWTEPDWSYARVVKADGFWQAHRVWEERLHLAEQAGQLGDLLHLAEESPVAQFRANAHLRAGIALRKANQFELALTQIDLALAQYPERLSALREKGICLQHLTLQGKSRHPSYVARLHYISLLKEYPDDPESWALLGDLDKALWVQMWYESLRTPIQMHEAAAEGESRLRAAIESYRQAFRRQPRFIRAGIQVLTLMQIYQYLTGETRFFQEANGIVNAVRYAIEFDPHPDYSSKVALSEMEVLVGNAASVSSAYKLAIAEMPTAWDALQASLQHLHLLQALDFHSETVMAGIEALEKALVGINPPAIPWQPRQVILFSGHIIDAPDRMPPRFPLAKAASAAARIAEALAGLEANSDDLALTQGAAGGDLLFIEACLQRGVRVQLLQPFTEEAFIERSILPATQGEDWRKRYLALRAQLKAAPRNLPEALGSLDETICNPFERCNRWLLSTALTHGPERLRFMCLWDGESSDQRGGTVDMIQTVNKLAVPTIWINTQEL